jgi:hypothetical protein
MTGSPGTSLNVGAAVTLKRGVVMRIWHPGHATGKGPVLIAVLILKRAQKTASTTYARQKLSAAIKHLRWVVRNRPVQFSDNACNERAMYFKPKWYREGYCG